MTMFRINPGKYRQIITIQKLIENRNDYGEIDRRDPASWENVKSVRAGIFPISGKEVLTAEYAQADISHRVHFRWFPTPIDSTMRIKYGERVFEITAPPVNFQERDMEYQIMCRERIEDNS